MSKTGRPNREERLRQAGKWFDGMTLEQQKDAYLDLPIDGNRKSKLDRYGVVYSQITNREADEKLKSVSGQKTNTIDRGFRSRMYPTKDQAHVMSQMCGQSRKMWNFLTAKSNDLRKSGQPFPNRSEIYTESTKLINGNSDKLPEWMKLLSGASRNSVIGHFLKAREEAFKNIKDRSNGKTLRKVGFPKFHARKSYRSYDSHNSGEAHVVEENGKTYIKIPKVPGRILLARNSYIPIGIKINSYSVSCLVDEWHVSLQLTIPRPECVGLHDRDIVGIDPGIKTALTLSDGTVYEAPYPLKRAYKEKRRLQRKISRAYEARKLRNGKVGKGKAKGPIGSNERNLRAKLAKLENHISDIRCQWQHRTTDEICRRYSGIRIQPSIGRLKSGGKREAARNRKALDIGISEICRQLKYKSDWYGCIHGYEEPDQYFPSTQLCSDCGRCTGPKTSEELNKRTWVCSNCGKTHNRDLNAAINIKDYPEWSKDNSGWSRRLSPILAPCSKEQSIPDASVQSVKATERGRVFAEQGTSVPAVPITDGICCCPVINDARGEMMNN